MTIATRAELSKRISVICSTFPSRIEGEVENTIVGETYLMALGGCDILDVDKVLSDLIHGFPEPRKWRPTPPELAQMVRDAASLRETDPDLKARFKVFVAKGTPQWNAWQSLRKTPCTMSESGKTGWWFRSEWPPGADQDKWDAQARREHPHVEAITNGLPPDLMVSDRVRAKRVAKVSTLLGPMSHEQWVAECIKWGTIKPYGAV